MTQTCVNPGNVPDNDECIPSAFNGTARPMTGGNWPAVTGGGSCVTNTDCAKGRCEKGACVCPVDDGMSAGAHCNLTAIQCPEYQDASCCSWEQNQALADNFKLIGSLFGKNAHGGCDACALNLMTFWCGLVCAPNQDEFMSLTLPYPSTTVVPDPMHGNKPTRVLAIDLDLDTEMSCALFDSCEHTALVSMASPMQSALGFLNYQGQTGAIGHGQLMHFSFRHQNQSFAHDMVACQNYSQLNRSLIPTQALILPSIAQDDPAERICPCASCRDTCAMNPHEDQDTLVRLDLTSNPISIWAGFQFSTVAWTYLVIVVLMVYQKVTRAPQRQDSRSWDDYHYHALPSK